MNDDFLILEEMFSAAVEAADPAKALAKFLPERRDMPVVVVGAGKASAIMASELEKAWEGPVSGAVAVPYRSRRKCSRVEIIEAAHPVPDENGLRAATLMLELVSGLGSGDLVVSLISGGGSALLPMPPRGLTLCDEQELNRALLASGAPISAMNTVRREASGIKGGRLALAALPAKVITYVISDVPDDNPADVASGPTVPGRPVPGDAMNCVERYGISLPGPVADHIMSRASPPPHADDPAFAGMQVHVIASAAASLEAAAAVAERHGLNAAIVSSEIEGEAREVGTVMAAVAREVSSRDRPFRKPVAILSGGETTVTLRNGGKGGRNTEFLLSFALAIEGCAGVAALAADTDGIDGTATNAGAFADGQTSRRIALAGLSPADLLGRNDSYRAFEAAGTLFETGPTGTNVNDFRAIIVR